MCVCVCVHAPQVVTYKLSGGCRERLKKVAAQKEELLFKKSQAARDKAALGGVFVCVCVWREREREREGNS